MIDWLGMWGSIAITQTLAAMEYYFKVPEDLEDRAVIVHRSPCWRQETRPLPLVDRRQGGKRVRHIKMLCLLAASRRASRPSMRSTPRWRAAVDEQLNDHGYIMPGIGDAGDRLYGIPSDPCVVRIRGTL